MTTATLNNFQLDIRRRNIYQESANTLLTVHGVAGIQSSVDLERSSKKRDERSWLSSIALYLADAYVISSTITATPLSKTCLISNKPLRYPGYEITWVTQTPSEEFTEHYWAVPPHPSLDIPFDSMITSSRVTIFTNSGESWSGYRLEGPDILDPINLSPLKFLGYKSRKHGSHSDAWFSLIEIMRDKNLFGGRRRKKR